ncbi:hypothetical protein GCM10009710_11130 [Aeromicrobium alkaliterrae]|uniref:Uncharacterized protein n=1 Tax=Aeromicrobium alkaliterrae TaxID=302168 RepID=A0ABN2JMF2_9ACTN
MTPSWQSLREHPSGDLEARAPAWHNVALCPKAGEDPLTHIDLGPSTHPTRVFPTRDGRPLITSTKETPQPWPSRFV